MEDVSLAELRTRVGEEALVLLDVRSNLEYIGAARASCDPRHGHIAGARNLPLEELLACGGADDIRALVGAPQGTEVIAYCHSGTRSAFAVQVLRAAGYEARNYVGSWHEWSREPDLPGE